MTWFIISIFIYVAVLALLLVLIHRGGEKAIRDFEGRPEEELEADQKAERLARRMGLPANAAQGLTVGDDGKPASKGKGCLMGFVYIVWLAVAVGLPCLATHLINLASVPQGFTRLTTDALLAVFLAAGAFGFCVFYMLPLCFTKVAAFLEKADKSALTGKSVSKTVRAARIAVLFMFAVTFPFFSLGLSFNGAYNEREIRYNAFFAITESVTPYAEVKEVRRAFDVNSDTDEVTGMRYKITLNGGHVIDPLYAGQPTMQTYKIHGYLKAAKPALFLNQPESPPLASIMKFLEAEYQEKAWERVLFIFDIQ
ncbi:MAG: hypothetical protein FWD58_05685 [Firmicutes bacterium]|nr:hypothetical protein [Bacillota bacterium]